MKYITKLLSCITLCLICSLTFCGCVNSYVKNSQSTVKDMPTPIPTIAPYPFKSELLVDSSELMSIVETAAQQPDKTLSDYDSAFCAYIFNRYYIQRFATSEEIKRFAVDLYVSLLTSQAEYEIPEGIDLTSEDIKILFTLLLADSPELIHVKGSYKIYTYKASDRVESIEFEYQSDPETYAQYLSEIYRMLSKWKEETADFDSFYKELYVYNKIINNCTYSQEADNSSNAYGALIAGEALCEGYSDALTLAMHYMGIPCVQICGDAFNTETESSEPHAWNLVCINDEWYQTDPTWDDYNNELTGSMYAYMNITDASVEETRTVEYMYNEYGLPECTSLTYNYHYANDLMINTGEDTKTIFLTEVSRAMMDIKEDADGKMYTSVTLKAETSELYNELIDNDSDWIKEFNDDRDSHVISSMLYTYDDNLLVIRYEFTVKLKQWY